MEVFFFLEQNVWALWVTVALLGLIVGSFLNVVIHRLPIMMMQDWRLQCAEFLEQTVEVAKSFNLIQPRSQCPHCGHLIAAWENIPIFSYLGLRGRCYACHQPISLRYPLVELLSAILAVIVAWQLGYGWPLVGGLLLTWALLALSVIDIDHQLLPDSITLPFLWLGLLFNLFGIYTDLASAVIGAMVGYGSLWLVYMIFKLVTGKEGMGFGDFKLLAMLGAWMGWQMLPLIILLSSFVGAIVGVGLILLRGQDRNLPIPFGPYLACAGWIGLLWGNELLKWYYQGVSF